MQDFGRRIPFAFLEDVKERYFTQFGELVYTAPAYEHNAAFSGVLQERMEFYSSNQKADTINRVRGEISEVKNVMIQNIDKVSSPSLDIHNAAFGADYEQLADSLMLRCLLRCQKVIPFAKERIF